MKSKPSKITVATRVPQILRDELEQEAWQEGLSFCAYLEKLINTRGQEKEPMEEDQIYSNLKNEKDELLDRVGELEQEKDMQKSISNGFEEKEKELQKQIEELEGDLLIVQTEKEEIENLLESNELELENAITLSETDALSFLQEKFTDYSKEELVEHCLQLAAINENNFWTVYKLTDYFGEEISFFNS